jgi:hypothetical protein
MNGFSFAGRAPNATAADAAAARTPECNRVCSECRYAADAKSCDRADSTAAGPCVAFEGREEGRKEGSIDREHRAMTGATRARSDGSDGRSNRESSSRLL